MSSEFSTKLSTDSLDSFDKLREINDLMRKREQFSVFEGWNL